MFEYSFLTLTAFSAASGVLLCLYAVSLSNWLRLVDIPDERKVHRAATPLMGGLVLLLAFIPPAIISVWLLAPERWVPSLFIWLGSIGVMALVGIADDRHSLSPRVRLLISFAVFIAAAGFDPTLNVRMLDFEYPRLG